MHLKSIWILAVFHQPNSTLPWKQPMVGVQYPIAPSRIHKHDSNFFSWHIPRWIFVAKTVSDNNQRRGSWSHQFHGKPTSHPFLLAHPVGQNRYCTAEPWAIQPIFTVWPTKAARAPYVSFETINNGYSAQSIQWNCGNLNNCRHLQQSKMIQ